MAGTAGHRLVPRPILPTELHRHRSEIPALRTRQTTTAPPADADPEADADLEGAADPESGPVLVPLAGTWSFADGAGEMDCGSLVIPIAELPAQLGEMKVLDGGTRLIITSPGRAVIEAVVEAGATVISATYVGAISAADASGRAAPEGVEDLVYTAVFDSGAHAITHVGGLLNSGDTVCAIDRPGVGIKTGQ
jgi:hypothetical protein